MQVRKNVALVAIVACSLVAMASSASAALVNVDFGWDADGYVQTGAGVIGASGDVWNTCDSLATGAGKALVTSSGTASGIMMYWSSESIYGFNSKFSGTSVHPLTRDMLSGHTGGTVPSISLGGSLAAGTYDLYLYSASDSDTRSGTYTVTAGETVISKTIGPQGSGNTLYQGGNYEVFRVTVGAGQSIGITGSSDVEVDINGFQLQSVPEPTSTLLLGTGILGLLAYAWRKHK